MFKLCLNLPIITAAEHPHWCFLGFHMFRLCLAGKTSSVGFFSGDDDWNVKAMHIEILNIKIKQTSILGGQID